MANTGYPAQGSVLGRGAGTTPEVYTTIANIDGFGAPGESMTMLDVTALDDTVRSTQKRVYAVVDAINFDGAQFRRDIGWRALEPR